MWVCGCVARGCGSGDRRIIKFLCHITSSRTRDLSPKTNTVLPLQECVLNTSSHAIKRKRGKGGLFSKQKPVNPKVNPSLHCGPTTSLVRALLQPADLLLTPGSANCTSRAASPLTTSRLLTSFSWFECAPGLSREIARCRRGPWQKSTRRSRRGVQQGPS